MPIGHTKWIGFLLAPLVAPVISLVWILFFSRNNYLDVGVLFALLAVTVFSYAASLLLGGPFILLLRRLNRLSFWWVVSGAAPLGALSVNLLILGTGGYIVGPVWLPLAQVACGGAVLGIGVAAMYCKLAGIGTLRAKH